MSSVLTSTEQHDGDVTCIAHHNGYIYTGGSDGKIKIWDKNLNLKRSLDMHDSYIYAIAAAPNGTIYSSSADGSVKLSLNPVEDGDIAELLRCDDVIQCLYFADDRLYTGDEKGVVTKWEKNKITFKYNLVEEVNSLAVEGSLIYSARDNDVVISEMVAGKSGKYTNKATISGRGPLVLFGAIVAGHHSLLGFTERDGKGLNVARNLPGEKFAIVWTKVDCHEMIINSICATDKYLYSGGYDGIVKQWSNIESSTPTQSGEVLIGCCINAICVAENETDVFIAATDGKIRRAGFA